MRNGNVEGIGGGTTLDGIRSALIRWVTKVGYITQDNIGKKVEQVPTYNENKLDMEGNRNIMISILCRPHQIVRCSLGRDCRWLYLGRTLRRPEH